MERQDIFLVEIMNPPGILLCGSGIGFKSVCENDGWISYTNPATMFWELCDPMFWDMPVVGCA